MFVGRSKGTRAPGAGRLLGWAVVAFAAALVARATMLAHIQVVLISPLTGLAYLWLASGVRKRRWLVDVPALSAVATLAALVGGATPHQLLLAAAMTPIQPLVTIMLMRRWCPDLWGSGGSRPLSTLRDVSRFLAAAAVGATVYAALRSHGLGLVPALPPVGIVMTWIRNYCWIVSVGLIGLQLGPAIERSGAGLWRESLDQLRRMPLMRQLEAASVVLVTGGSFVMLLAVPVKFSLLLVTVWVALRFTPLAATIHGFFCGLVGMLLALSGLGEFAADQGALASAAIAQALACVMVITGAAVAISVQARKHAVARAEAAEAAAEERSALLDAVIANFREGVVVLRADGTELIRNRAADSILAVPRKLAYDAALPGPTYGIFEAGGRRVEVPELPHARALEGESVPVRDFLVRSPENPEGVVLEIGATHLPPSRPTESGLAVVNFRDVTDDRRERDNLAAFAGVVAHDLSNPLSVVNGWAEALLDEFALGRVDGADGTAMVSRIQDAATQMQQFITDLLSYTVARDQALRLEPVDLSGLAESVASMRREASSRPRISVQPGLQVFADVALTRQLLDNLIGNAVKYVAPGTRPRIDVSAVDRGDFVCVMVCDNGIGVPPDRRRDIFENFQRAHVGDYSGTGIGLAICQRIVERHGGTIEVEDNPFGHGSLFSFTLPSRSTQHLVPDAEPGAVGPLSAEAAAPVVR